MVLTPLLTAAGAALARRVARPRATEPEAATASLPEVRRENHVVVAGYGQAARRLVRVLDGSRIPYVITTLSPDGANEAEAEGLPVLRGDASRQHTLLGASADRAKVLVVADDDPAIARRVVSVARIVNPTMRILVRTRYIAEIEPLVGAGADRVIAEELESVVAALLRRDAELRGPRGGDRRGTRTPCGAAAMRRCAAPSSPRSPSSSASSGPTASRGARSRCARAHPPRASPSATSP